MTYAKEIFSIIVLYIWHWTLYKEVTTLKPLKVKVNITDHLSTVRYSAGKPWILIFMPSTPNTHTSQAHPAWQRHTLMTLVLQHHIVCCHTTKMAREQPEEELKIWTWPENASHPNPWWALNLWLRECCPDGVFTWLQQSLGGCYGFKSIHIRSQVSWYCS